MPDPMRPHPIPPMVLMAMPVSPPALPGHAASQSARRLARDHGIDVAGFGSAQEPRSRGPHPLPRGTGDLSATSRVTRLGAVEAPLRFSIGGSDPEGAGSRLPREPGPLEGMDS